MKSTSPFSHAIVTLAWPAVDNIVTTVRRTPVPLADRGEGERFAPAEGPAPRTMIARGPASLPEIPGRRIHRLRLRAGSPATEMPQRIPKLPEPADTPF